MSEQNTAPATSGTPAANPAPAPALVPGSPEYNAAMIAKAEGVVILGDNGQPAPPPPPAPEGDDKDNTQVPEGASPKGTPPPPPQKPVKPEHVPDKFWNAETGVVDYAAWARSTHELESTLTRTNQKNAAEKQLREAEAELAAAADDTAKAAAQTKVDAAKAAVEKASAAAEPPPAAGLQATLEACTAEFEREGKLSEQSYAALEKAGHDRATVDAYIEGIQAKGELYALKVHTEAGGSAEYAKMLKWAETGYSQEQIDAFDEAVTSGDVAKATAAVKTLKGLYVAANGQPPAQRISGDANSSGIPQAHFRSASEVTAAMRDARYRTDSAYRAEVAQKIGASVQLGIDLGTYG